MTDSGNMPFAKIILILLPTIILACTPFNVTITQLLPPFKSPLPDRYNLTQFTEQFPISQFRDFVEDTKTMYSCVDCRLTRGVLGTPGGDFGEFVAALQIFFTMQKMEPSVENIRNVFDKYMNEVISPERPFYYHTDDKRLRSLFANMSGNPSIFPQTTPENANEWIEKLKQPQYHGCGHIRLMLENATNYEMDPLLLRNFIQVFFHYYWELPVEKKNKIFIEVALGNSIAKGVVIVSNQGPGCQKQSPLVTPSMFGATNYVYHEVAVGNFRQEIMVPFFSSLSATLDREAFGTELLRVTEKNLKTTIENLSPANRVNIVSIAVHINQQPSRIDWIMLIIVVVSLFVLVIVLSIVVTTVVIVCNLRTMKKERIPLKDDAAMRERSLNKI